MQALAAHVDRLDAIGAAFFHCLDVAVHKKLIVLHQTPERTQREADDGDWHVVASAHVEHKAAALHGEMQHERTQRRGCGFHRERCELVAAGAGLLHRLRPVGFHGRGKGRGNLTFQHYPGKTVHPISGSGFSMLKHNMTPTMAPLIGRIRPTDRTSVSGRKIADSSQVGGSSSFCMISMAGITMWPTMRMVK